MAKKKETGSKRLFHIAVLSLCGLLWAITAQLFIASPPAAALPNFWKIGMGAFIGFIPAVALYFVVMLNSDSN